MKNFDKDIRKYRRQTKRLLTCPIKYRRQLLDSMERDLQHFLEENPSAGYSDAVALFGSPEDLAQTYLDDFSQKEISDFRNKRKFIIYTAIIVMISLLLGTIMLLFFELKSQENEKVYIYESIEIQEENIAK